MIHAFIYGLILAFGLIIPLGVQNVFIFNQGASQKHFLHALPSVIAASLCDTALIILAVLGVSVMVLSLSWLKLVFLILGFFFLLYMGYVTWNTRHPIKIHQKPLSPKQQIGFTLSVSLLNPHAIIDSVGVIGTNSLRFTGNAKMAFTIACIVVSCVWFFSLSVLGHTLHNLDKTGRCIFYLNKLSALIIWAVAVMIGWEVLLII